MTETILHQGPGFTIARSDVAETLVPYYYAERPDGSVNFGWIDLRGRPDLVAQVPEAARSAGLFEILCAIANPESPLMSGACECAAFEREDEPAELRWQVGGFVTIMFQDAEHKRQPEELVRLACAVLSRIAPVTDHNIGFSMTVEPLKQFFGRAGCHCLAVKPLGYGETESIAWAAFEHAAMAVARALQQWIESSSS